MKFSTLRINGIAYSTFCKLSAISSLVWSIVLLVIIIPTASRSDILTIYKDFPEHTAFLTSLDSAYFVQYFFLSAALSSFITFFMIMNLFWLNLKIYFLFNDMAIKIRLKPKAHDQKGA